jgi:hypothetical protein
MRMHDKPVLYMSKTNCPWNEDKFLFLEPKISFKGEIGSLRAVTKLETSDSDSIASAIFLGYKNVKVKRVLDSRSYIETPPG